MAYTIQATSKCPALIIYLLDVSGSMGSPLNSKNGQRKIDYVMSSLELILKYMVRRSTKGEIIAPRYRIALLAYSSKVNDLFGGVITVDQWAQKGSPVLQATELTDTAAAFQEAERILKDELPKLPADSPAPLVCHLTDGMFNGPDPEPIAQSIMQMSNNDGHVLVENIYIANSLTTTPITDITLWSGICSEKEVTNGYAAKLLRMSSPIPESYRTMMLEYGFQINEKAKLLFPADSPELIELGFVTTTVSGL